MIGLDTNLVVRFLIQDDPVQTRIAEDVLERRLTPEFPGFLSIIALTETAWVLRSTYKLSAVAVASAIERLLSMPNLRIQHSELVLDAALSLRTYGGDFADALIGEINAAAGCTMTLSFDRRALRLPGFEHP